MPELSPTVYLGRRVVRYAPTQSGLSPEASDITGIMRFCRQHVRAPRAGENAGHARVLHLSLGFRPCLS